MLTDFYVFDTETGTKKNGKYGYGIYWELNARPESFQFGVVYGHNYQRVIYSVDEFKEEFKKERYKGKKVFAHNFGKYDGTVLYGSIFELDPSAVFNGKFICCTNGVCTFADSLNIFQTSIEELGKMIGIKKPDLGEKGKMFSKEIGPDEINRCVTDCEILYESLIRIFEDAGDIKITQASLSMTYFRRFHQPYDIHHNDNTKYFWDSYFGGRCEAFYIGKTHAIVEDANSMYPYIMDKEVFPNPRTLKYQLNVPVKNLARYLDHYEGCVYCDVHHRDHRYGFLPYKLEGKLCFPVGNFSGCWNFNELRYAIEQKIVIVRKIHKIVYGERMPSPFKGYVQTLYANRLKAQRLGDSFEEYRIKIFMNSLYGKFAQRILSEEIYIKDVQKQYHIIEDYQKKGLFVKLSMFNCDRKDAMLVVKATKFKDLSYSIPSFASYITSGARVHLLKKLIERINDKVVYCDTDSVFFEIANNIHNGSGLGQWKIENKIVTEIKGLKNYKFCKLKDGKQEEEKRRLKGVPANAEQVGENDYIYYNLINNKEALRRNLLPGVKIKRTKHINNIYSKRKVEKDGTTKPIIIL